MKITNNEREDLNREIRIECNQREEDNLADKYVEME